MRLEGRRALVTGGARGIGRAIVERLTADGATVFAADVDYDVSDPAAVDRLADEVGRLDIVVANAGVQTFAAATELTTEDWDRVLDVNARGTFLTLQLAARCLGDGGSVVTVSSIQALLPNPLSVHYSASKAAVLSLTRSFAAELAPRRIRVNAVAPGRVDTGLSDYASTEVGRLTGSDADEALERRIAMNPLGRTGTPAEVAAVVAFLASDDASYVTGECINVCGGDVMA